MCAREKNLYGFNLCARRAAGAAAMTDVRLLSSHVRLIVNCAPMWDNSRGLRGDKHGGKTRLGTLLYKR